MYSNKLFVLIAISLACLYAAQSKPWEPSPRPEQWWMDRHNSFVENSRVNGSRINIVFMGSSVCEYWGREGRAIWDRKYAPLGAVNYGIGGDLIEHCLWRIQNQELANLNPKILMLYCGSNNVPGNPATAEIVRGITDTLNDLARRLPNTKILYVTINPRGDSSIIEELWGRITVINAQILQQHDGNKRNIFTMFDNFISSWGQIRQDLYLSDKLHLNEAGYQHWDNLWNSTFFNLWNS